MYPEEPNRAIPTRVDHRHTRTWNGERTPVAWAEYRKDGWVLRTLHAPVPATITPASLTLEEVIQVVTVVGDAILEEEEAVLHARQRRQSIIDRARRGQTALPGMEPTP